MFANSVIIGKLYDILSKWKKFGRVLRSQDKYFVCNKSIRYVSPTSHDTYVTTYEVDFTLLHLRIFKIMVSFSYVKAFLMFFHFAIRISISNKNKSKPMQRRMKNRNYFTIRIIQIMSPHFSFDKQYPWSFNYTKHTNFPMRILYRRFDINTIFCKKWLSRFFHVFKICIWHNERMLHLWTSHLPILIGGKKN